MKQKILTNSTEQSFEKLGESRNYPPFMEPDGSLQSSQQHVTGPYIKLHEYSP
jgi:hypothetical protein